MTNLVTPSQIAAAAQVTEKHVRRMISRAQGSGPYVPTDWFGVRMRVVVDDGALLVEFASLPDHIRDAVLVR